MGNEQQNEPSVQLNGQSDDSDDDMPLSSKAYARKRDSDHVPKAMVNLKSSLDDDSDDDMPLSSKVYARKRDSDHVPKATANLKKSSDDHSDDDTPLSAKIYARKQDSDHVPKAMVDLKNSSDDPEDDIPLSLKFQMKATAGPSLTKSVESKGLKANKTAKVLSKRPRDEGNSSNRASVKKPKISHAKVEPKEEEEDDDVSDENDDDYNPSVKRMKKSVSSNGKSASSKKTPSVQSSVKKSKLSHPKVEPKEEVEEEDEDDDADVSDEKDDDYDPVVQLKKKAVSPNGKTPSLKKTKTEVISSKSKKTIKKSKKLKKCSKYSKSTNVPPSSGEGQKWTTLVHNGVIFPPPYKPHGVQMLYNGKPVELTPEQEEVATMFAVMKDTEYATKPRFLENFMNDWRQILGKNHVIKQFELCDFTPIYEWHQMEKEKKKQMTTEEKKVLKEEKLKQEDKYMWAIVDGIKEKVGNFRVEPPGLFRGRGEHPKMGKLKSRISPSDITINIGKDSPIPECPIPGERWKEVRHDNTVTWLAFWNDPISQKEFKYVFLAASSSLKGQSDKEKYEKARLLKDYIHNIRTTYTKNFTSKDVMKRQIAVATYLIDKLALRAGNEKDDDEADTVGCCTLKVENVALLPPNKLQFDFLGKDSIRYFNTVDVELPVYKAIGDFRNGKAEGDDLFDKLDTSKLNAHLKELMPGLTAKVFRTYNASITLDEMLNRETKDGNVAEKIVVYQHANKEVAIICNHQRTVSKSHSIQMSKLTEKMNELKDILDGLKADLARAKKGKTPSKGSDGKPKKNIASEALERKISQTDAKIEKMERDMKTKEDLKTVALGTSKINYLDPRISVAWCKRHEVPIEKIFNKSLLAKFSWAMDVDLDFRF